MKTGVQSTYFDVGLWGPGAKKGCPYYISIKPANQARQILCTQTCVHRRLLFCYIYLLRFSQKLKNLLKELSSRMIKITNSHSVIAKKGMARDLIMIIHAL
jgi:hypothetical protein